ncbi:extracytoplasmic sigma factor ECF [Gemmatimonadetes bacterium T265]|nr:extracytoplasmic sigma factor ECF [Gemmatimonadetes bacterium T265]
MTAPADGGPPGTVTALLNEAGAGDAEALDAVFALVYEELRRLAHWVRRARAGATLSSTALVHEAYLKLVPGGAVEWRSRAHFFAVAARAMRQVLVDAARQRLAAKRNADLLVTLDDHAIAGAVAAPLRPERLVALDEALDRLAAADPRQARVIEYRFFAGLSVEETAAVLGVSAPTVKRDWRVARAWIAAQLGDAAGA